MQRFNIRNFLLLLLATIFSIALMYSFVEIPRLLDSIIQSKVESPGFDPGSNELASIKTDAFIKARGIKIVGYSSLILIVIFILVGFLTKKSGWALGGAILAFLPVFGGFAMSMFYLAGLGFLRSGLMPFQDISPVITQLGDIMYLPYWLLIKFFYLFDYFAHKAVVYFFMTSGAIIFIWGVYIWVESRFNKNPVANRFIYRYSRHPQYLGWIIWSYGFFIYSCALNQMKKSWWFDPTFSWILMTMIIIAVCMLEEIKMKKLYGKQYDNYKSSTPFLFPIPKWLLKIIKLPGRLIIRKKEPETKKDVALIICVYTIILMLLSIPVLNVNAYGNPRFFRNDLIRSRSQTSILRSNQQETAPDNFDSLLAEYSDSLPWQVRYRIINEMAISDIERSLPYIYKSLVDPEIRIRRLSVDILYKAQLPESIPWLEQLSDDPDFEIRFFSNQAIKEIQKK